jgi:hypothetical protein
MAPGKLAFAEIDFFHISALAFRETICPRGSPMYLRLAFWTLAMAYTSVLLSRGTGGASPSTMLTAALLGAVVGFSLGGMLINRRTRKRG